MDFNIKSEAFSDKGEIPVKYTCKGMDITPPLSWSGTPAGTKSYAIIADDPDAPMGTWVHWVMWNIPAEAKGLPENLSKSTKLPDGSMQGVTDFKRNGYGGPCPPSGTHRYFFKLYALDTLLNLQSSADKTTLEAAMEGHILAKATLMGIFSKK